MIEETAAIFAAMSSLFVKDSAKMRTDQTMVAELADHYQSLFSY
jgi:hypothetical protein